MTIVPDFYDADAIERVAINLFYGWGYNFYRVENQMRADDQRVRSQVGALLSAARASVEAAESAWRRDHLPAPTREHPQHDAQALAGARTLERLAQAIGALASRMQALPTPENDRMTQRWRREADALARLIACDQTLSGRAELLRATLDGQAGAWIIDNAGVVEQGLATLDATLRERQGVIL